MANYEDPDVVRLAKAVATAKGWHCIRRTVSLERGSRVGLLGRVKLSARQLEIQEPATMSFPLGSTFESTLDAEAFRECLVVAGGKLQHPPPTRSSAGVERLREPAGLTYVRNFLSEDEEAEIVARIDECAWLSELKRRVQHYGWSYDYRQRRIGRRGRLGELPEWLEELAHRLVRRRLLPSLPDQVIVNEYRGSQGISPHVDRESSFADGIAMVSLLESWEMWFRHRDTRRKVAQLLERRSVAVMEGAARYEWTHEIPRRKTEPSMEGRRVPRIRRLSLTFRKVVEERASSVAEEEGRLGGG